MRKQAAPSERDLDPESIKRRTELFMKYVYPHKGMIFDIAIKFTKQKKFVEDNFSDVLTTLFRYIESYSPNKCIKSWIYISSVRLILDANERNERILLSDNIPIESIGDSSDSRGVSCNSLGMDNYKEHYSDDILEALDNLPPIHKEVLLLQQAGYKISEIVEISFQNGTLKSKSSETIKSRLFLAKKKMRLQLTREGVFKAILNHNEE
ncbi:MAG: RNA polymerase sigma factor [Rikenellaceae bacterium]